MTYDTVNKGRFSYITKQELAKIKVSSRFCPISVKQKAGSHFESARLKHYIILQLSTAILCGAIWLAILVACYVAQNITDYICRNNAVDCWSRTGSIRLPYRINWTMLYKGFLLFSASVVGLGFYWWRYKCVCILVELKGQIICIILTR